MKKLNVAILAFTLMFSVKAFAGAPEPTADDGGGDLRSAVQNPISSLISLPFKFEFDYGAKNGQASFLNIQPVIPVTVGEWNLVNRVIMPIIDSPGEVSSSEIPNPIPGSGATGLGDINYSLFFSPVDSTSAIWGVGPSITLDTASNKQLGSGKWSGGLTGVVLLQPDWGTYGGLVRQLWSFAGDSNRRDVNNFLFEPFINFNLANGWYLISDMVMTANWDAPSSQQWTIPIGGGVGKLFTIGSQPINVRAEAYSNVKKPDSAPDWKWGFTVQFLFPK